ncbi:NAD(P)H-binding protein [Streptomyces sioyaensis]|uniref:NAD(P)H-binding protein n=1 Tax=Streptomyces sioyaensis TaxID=67364 RepID=UPI0037B75F3A
MNVLIMGVTTALGTQVADLLHTDGHDPVGLVPRTEQAIELRARGIAAVSLTKDDPTHTAIMQAVADADAMVLATGTGPYTSGASSPMVQLMRAAEAVGTRRFVLVNAQQPTDAARTALGARLDEYLREKQEAELSLRESNLEWCVLRPGLLDDSPSTGNISVQAGDDPWPETGIGRADLARTIYELVTMDRAVRAVLAVSAGATHIRRALESIPS